MIWFVLSYRWIEIAELQDIIEKYYLNYKLKRGKTYNFVKYSVPVIFLIDIHEEYLSLEDTVNKQSNFATEFWWRYKKTGKKVKKRLF